MRKGHTIYVDFPVTLKDLYVGKEVQVGLGERGGRGSQGRGRGPGGGSGLRVLGSWGAQGAHCLRGLPRHPDRKEDGRSLYINTNRPHAPAL